MRHGGWMVLVLLTAAPAGAQEKALSISWEADWVTAVALAGPSKQLVAGNKLGQIAVWNTNGQLTATPPVRRLDGHTNQITHLAATADGRWLVSASLDRTVRIWDLKAPVKGKGTLALDALGFRRGKELTAKVEEYPVEIQEAAQVLTAHRDWVRGLSLAADGKQVLTGDDTGLMILWQLPEGKEVQRIQTKGWLRGVALGPDGRQAVSCTFAPRSAGLPNVNILWDLGTGEQVRALAEAKDKERGLEAADFSRDGKTVAFAEGGEFNNAVGKVFLVDAPTGKKRLDLPGHYGGVAAVAFSPDGKRLATGGRDTMVRLWQVSDGKKLAEFGKSRGGQSRDWIHAVAWSADGQWIAAADMGGMVHVFQTRP